MLHNFHPNHGNWYWAGSKLSADPASGKLAARVFGGAQPGFRETEHESENIQVGTSARTAARSIGPTGIQPR